MPRWLLVLQNWLVCREKKHLLDVTSVENKTSSGEVGKISKPPLGLPSPIDGGLHGVP